MPDLAALRCAPWLTRQRVIGWACVLLVLEVAFTLFIAAWQRGAFGPIEFHHSADFVSFHAAGALALAGTPALAYDHAAHHLVQQQTTAIGTQYQYFFYPPVFLLLCAPLALMPYFVAYGLFQAVTFGLLLFALHRIARPVGWAWVIPVCAFPPVFWNIGVGQNAFLTAALLAGFTLMLDRRPAASGAMLGLLCYKPHYGLLAPFALAAGQRWRAFAAAAGVVAALLGLSWLLFGTETWRAYLVAASGSSRVYESGRIDLAGMVTVFGALRLLGVAPAAAWAAQAVAAALMAGLVVLVWRRPGGASARSAVLLSATLLAVPLSLLYDQMILLVAMAWLLREAREGGFLPWEKLVLFAVWPLALLTWSTAGGWGVPLAPFTHLAVLYLGLRRVWAMQAVATARPAAIPS